MSDDMTDDEKKLEEMQNAIDGVFGEAPRAAALSSIIAAQVISTGLDDQSIIKALAYALVSEAVRAEIPLERVRHGLELIYKGYVEAMRQRPEHLKSIRAAVKEYRNRMKEAEIDEGKRTLH